MGPTASGKTQLAVDLVQHLPCEIISVDSVMVYRGMNIGAAKPDAHLLQMAPHHLIDIADPADIYSAGRFRVDALRTINEIISKNKIPLLVGGSMLYFRILQQGLAHLPSANPEIRAHLQARANHGGWEALHAELARYDETAAARIHVNDAHRIARALEVYLLTGQTITTLQTNATKPLADYQIYNLILAPENRAHLHENIAKRFAMMLELGLIDEVKALYARDDLNCHLSSIRSAGYAQVWAYLANQLTYDEMCEQAIAATRQLAKRQLTWLRSGSFHDALWFISDEKNTLSEKVFTLLQKLVD